MSIAYYPKSVGDLLITCDSGDVKPAVADGAFLIEKDTGNTFYRTGAAWVDVTPGGGGVSPLLTFITEADETADLPNSLQLVAGNDISFDTSTPNVLVIDSTASPGGGGWSSLYPNIVNPNLTTFAWVNQGGATEVDYNSGVGLHLNAPANPGNNQNMRIRVETAPSTPYIRTALLIPLTVANNNFGFCGIGFRESSTGELFYFRFGCVSGVWNLQTIKASSPTVNTAGVGQISNYPPTYPLFLQLEDDGTNLHFRFSWDGENWITLTSEGRTVFMASGPDGIFYFADSETANWKAAVTLISWG